MAKLVIVNGHQKDTSHNEIDLHAHNIEIVIGLFVDTTRREGLECAILREKYIHFDIL